MATKIISPGSRTANLGEAAPTARITPFQSFNTNVDMFGGAEARNTARTAQALGGVAKESENLYNDIAQVEETTSLLEADRELTTFIQDSEASYKGGAASTTRGASSAPTSLMSMLNPAAATPSMSASGVMGKNANKAWVETSMVEFDAKQQDLLARYGGSLRAPARLALERSLQTKRNAYRGNLINHWQTQSRIALNAELAAAHQVKVDTVISANSPVNAVGALKGVISNLEDSARLNGMGTLASSEAVRVAASKQVDDIAQTKIEDIINSGSASAVEQAREMLTALEEIKLSSGDVVKMSAEKRNDLVNLINKQKETDLVASAGMSAWAKSGQNIQQAEKAINDRKDLTPTQKLNAIKIARGEEQTHLARIDRERKERVRTVADIARQKGEQGLPLSAADVAGLTSAQEAAAQTIHKEAKNRAANPAFSAPVNPLIEREAEKEYINMKALGTLATKFDSVNEIEMHFVGRVGDDLKDTIINAWQEARLQKAKAEGKAETAAAKQLAKNLAKSTPKFDNVLLKDRFSTITKNVLKSDSIEYMEFRNSANQRLSELQAQGIVITNEVKRQELDKLSQEYIVYDQSDNWLSSDAKAFVGQMTDDAIKTMSKDLSLSSDDLPGMPNSSSRDTFQSNFGSYVDAIRRSSLPMSREALAAVHNRAYAIMYDPALQNTLSANGVNSADFMKDLPLLVSAATAANKSVTVNTMVQLFVQNRR
tara:strand:+ start:66 stop:2213 length:2148 start_codon:yes stop_codon:yes gene_type:complete